jgi:hypothetical protein
MRSQQNLRPEIRAERRSQNMGARSSFREKWRLKRPAVGAGLGEAAFKRRDQDAVHVAAKDDPLDLAARSDDPESQENALSPIPDQERAQ